MKEAFGKETQRVNVTKNDPLYLLSAGGQQKGEHRIVQHVQGEHYQRSLSGLACNLNHPYLIKEVPRP